MCDHDNIEVIRERARAKIVLAGITGMNNRNANCAEGDSGLLKLEKNITGVMRKRGDILAGSGLHSHTNVSREVYCPRKISSPCLKKLSKNMIEPDGSLSGSVALSD